MMKIRLLLFSCFMLLAGFSFAQTVVPDGDDLQAAVAAASNGDVLELVDGGIYITGEIVIDKEITIKAVDGAVVRPTIINEDGLLFSFGEMKTHYGFKLQGIRLASNNYKANICELLKNDSISFIVMSDLEVHDFGGSIIQARDGAERPHPIASLDSLVVDNCYFYDMNCSNKRGSFYLDRDDVQTGYIQLSNSSFVGFYKKFLDCGHPGYKKTVIVDHVNVVREDPLDGSKDEDLFEIRGDSLQESSITISNSIFGHQFGKLLFDFTQTPTAIIDSIYNCMLFDIDTTGTMYNEWIYDDYSFNDPMFSNDIADAMYLLPGSPALTASTTGGPIGDPRWAVLPDAASLLDLEFDADGQFLRPMFRSDHYSYTAVLPYPIDTVEVVATANFENATITGNNIIALEAGAAAQNVDVVVTAEDGVTTQTYTIALSRLAPGTNATLSSLLVRNDIDTLDLDPVFDPDTYTYTLDMPAGSPDTVWVEPDPTDETAYVTLEDDGLVSLVDGPVSVEIIVTAEDGLTTITYTIDMRICGTGTDASLSMMTVGGVLLEGFDPAVFSYDVELDAGTTDVPLIDALPTDEAAEVVITQAADVNSSGTVEVYATDCIETSTYTVNFSTPNALNFVSVEPLNIYPNPALNSINLRTKSHVMYVDVFNILGEKVLTQTVASVNGEYTVDIDELSAGLYMIRAFNEDSSVSAGKFYKHQ